MAFSYDWDREVSTCEPEYYRWNQWFFLRMLERGLAYRKKALVNWCPECATVLANEQVVDGCCWRHETTPVEQRELEQWFLQDHRRTPTNCSTTSRSSRAAGPSACCRCSATGSAAAEGAEVDFTLEGTGEKIRVFTTRVDTIYGATCVILAPEHPLTQKLVPDEHKAARKGDDRGAARARTRATSKKKAFLPATTPSIRTTARRCRSGWRTSC